ncbi:hypothetical protein ABEG63_04640 [Chryseobacterium sp. C39-AII1]|uniref:hypothetical protein n=1 Tax=Chryseobacterium sp. C39-AII1 TaxID=3080332 RepID=UPI0032090465
MKDFSKKHIYLKLFFLILFLLGLSLFSLIEENIRILYISIPLLFPYILVVIYEYFKDKSITKRKNAHDEILTEKLLEIGIPVTINFEKGIKSIEEKHFQENENIGIFREYFWPIEYLFGNRSEEIFTLVELKYKVLGKTYIKKVMFPFSKQSTISLLKFQKTTILFYNEENPQQSIIDLRFIDGYL